MSERLREKLREYVVKRGEVLGIAELRAAAGNKSQRQIERYLSGEANPKPGVIYKLALACGLSDEEALELAKERSQAKETA